MTFYSLDFHYYPRGKYDALKGETMAPGAFAVNSSYVNPVGRRSETQIAFISEETLGSLKDYRTPTGIFDVRQLAGSTSILYRPKNGPVGMEHSILTESVNADATKAKDAIIVTDVDIIADTIEDMLANIDSKVTRATAADRAAFRRLMAKGALAL